MTFRLNFITSLILATSAQTLHASQSQFDVFNLLAPIITFTGDNLCAGVACPANPSSPYSSSFLQIGTGVSGANGELRVESGAQVTSSGPTTLGVNSGNNGTVTVAGSGSQLSSNALTVGSQGSGILTIADGGRVTVMGQSAIARTASSISQVLVTSNSEWNTGTLFIGDAGNATLTIENGGLVEVTGSSTIAQSTASISGVSVSGNGSKWTTNALLVGNSGKATLDIIDGGQVTSNTSILLANSASGEGVVTVSGLGSLMRQNQFRVGYRGKGTLNITSGGTVDSTGLASIGFSAGSSGEIHINGSNSLFSSQDNVFVGTSGKGVITIANGGQLSASGYISAGSASSGEGTISISDLGSELTTPLDFFIGGSGKAALNITNGGQVTATNNTIMANAANSESTVSLQNQGQLTTGQLSRGSGTSAQATFDGGIVRATRNETNFITGFQTNELLITSGGLAIDTNGFTVGTTNVFQGAGGLEKRGGGVLTLEGEQGYTGVTDISAGRLSLGAAGSIAASERVTLSDATAVLELSAGSSRSINNLSGVAGSGVTLNSELTVNESTDTDFAGSFSGAGGLVKQGLGTLTLSGDSSGYTGTTQVSQGTLAVGSLGRLTASDVTVDANATLRGTGDAVLGRNVVVNGTLASLGGTSSLSTLLLNPNSTLSVSLGAPTGTSVFDVDTDLTLDGTLVINQAPDFGAGVYRLMNYGGTLTNNGLQTNNPDFYLQTEIASQVNLVNSTGVTLNFWDGTGPYNNNQINGGSGTWNLTNGNWTNASGSMDGPYKPENAFAVFMGSAGTVSIDNTGGQVTAAGLQFAVDGYSLTGNALTLIGDGTVRVGDGSTAGASITATINAALTGNQGLNKTDLGTLVLNGVNTYTGTTTLSQGVLSVAQDSALGDAANGLQFNDGTLRTTDAFSSERAVSLSTSGTFDTAADLTLNGGVSGAGSLQKSGAGRLTLNQANTYSGDTVINQGTLTLNSTGSIAASRGVRLAAADATLEVAATGNQTINEFNGVAGSQVLADGALTFGTATNSAFAGQVQGAGALSKNGSGTAVWTGDSSGYTGAMRVNEGVLTMNGQLGGSVFIAANGTLAGNGTVGTTTVEGLVAPGNSIGTLTVNGNYTQTAGSVYQVEINPQGQSDRINVSGSAQIAGTVNVLPAPGTYVPDTSYTILHADGGVSGVYNELAPVLPYLTFALNYAPNDVFLNISRSAVRFADLARTWNELSTANAVEGLGMGNPVYDAVANATDEQAARYAFNSLSGEVHASMLSALLEEGRYLRAAVLNRMQNMLSEPGSVYRNQLNEATVAAGDDWSLWGNGFGSWGRLDGNGNAAALNRSIGGVFIGGDRKVGDALRVGLVSGYSNGTYNVAARSSHAASDSYYLGAYTGTRFNQWGLRLGGAYTWSDLDLTRSAAFPGFNNDLKTDTHAATGQVFAEVGYSTGIRHIELEPFAGAAYLTVDNDRWAEHGGAAALTGAGHNGVAYSSLGLREAAVLYQGAQYTVSEKVMLGWQHAYNGIVPNIAQQFATGSTPFMISGVPIAQNSLLVDAGLNWQHQAKNINLRLSYIGQFAEHVTDNGVAGVLSWRFA